MIIFYFTGTGNSLAVAKTIGGDLISIPQEMKQQNYKYEADAIGFVFPTYYLTAPKMVRAFLEKVELKADYIFAVTTYGDYVGPALGELQDMVSQYGWKFDYINKVKMVNNYLPLHDIKKEVMKLVDSKLEVRFQKVVRDVHSRVCNTPQVNMVDKTAGAISKSFVKKLDSGLSAQKFKIHDACTTCGTCAAVCPSGNIQVTDEVRFGQKCESCFACIHNCPQKAIYLKSERSDRRWRYPNTSLLEIIMANQQS